MPENIAEKVIYISLMERGGLLQNLTSKGGLIRGGLIRGGLNREGGLNRAFTVSDVL